MSTEKPIRIILADDHEIFRDGFRVMLKKEPSITLVGEAYNGENLLDVTAQLKPDVVLTDIKMPYLDGIEATRILRARFPEINIIALSMFDDDNLIIDMLEAGAKGYLLKNAAKFEIIEAVKTVYNGHIYYCKSTSEKLLNLLSNTRFKKVEETKRVEFSSREIEVVQLVCDGLSNKEIGTKLNISPRTVEGIREKLQEKMKVSNTVGIVKYSIKNGLYKM